MENRLESVHSECTNFGKQNFLTYQKLSFMALTMSLTFLGRSKISPISEAKIYQVGISKALTVDGLILDILQLSFSAVTHFSKYLSDFKDDHALCYCTS